MREAGAPYLLHSYLSRNVEAIPDQVAVVSRDLTLSYRELGGLSDSLAAFLRAKGAGRGERVGIYVPKSLASLVSIYGVLKAGAAYVPLDPTGPAPRLAQILRDSKIRTLLTCTPQINSLKDMIQDASPLKSVVLVDCDARPGSARMDPNPSLRTELISWETVQGWGEAVPPPDPIESDPAYVIYTSGSTGMPKGVVLSHRNALTFVEWAGDQVALGRSDRVSSHAPIHFDLSIFDIFSTCRAGATVVLVPEAASKFPVEMVKLISRQRISVWYSVPSALTLMVLYGNMKAHDLSSLRAVIFAGEVFPLKYLQALLTVLPAPRYLNWYGPTETNVCTYYEVKGSDRERTTPIPIGKACANTEVFAVDSDGKRVVAKGEEGELYVRGPSVMLGYLGDSEKTAKVLVQNPLDKMINQVVYRTGDIVELDENGDYRYIGRRDGMIKTRGYRVELGEVEAVLYQHPGVKEAVVIPVPDELVGNKLRAVVSPNDSHNLTGQELAAFCSGRLPRYMVPEIFELREWLPKTSTGKIDRVGIAATGAGGSN